jgi:biotin carboxyl carrier protein
MLVQVGDRVEQGGVIAIIEAMKTECDVTSPNAGVVREVYAQAKDMVTPGAPMIALEPG